MPKIKYIVKISIYIIISIFIIIYGSYLIFKFEDEQIARLIEIGITSAIGLFIAVFQIKGKKDVENIIEDVDKLKISINNVDEALMHKREITNLCQEIENLTALEFSKESKVNKKLQAYIISVNEAITITVKDQYAYDFNLFDPVTFHMKLANKINQLSVNHIHLSKECFKKIQSKIHENISDYIDEIQYIKGLENGTRRDNFKKLTLKLSNNITYHSIDLYKESYKHAV